MTDAHVQFTDPSSRTSSSLLERARAQDQAAWGRLVSLYGPLVYRWCRQSGLQPADAADVGQEVFEAVARKLDDFRRDRPGDTFRGWLRTITRNKVRDWARRRRTQGTAAGGEGAYQMLLQVPAGDEDHPDYSARGDEVRLLYHRAVELIRGDFEERSWQAFWRVVVEGQRPADVAQDLGVSVNAVYLAKSRVLRRLRDQLPDADQ